MPRRQEDAELRRAPLEALLVVAVELRVDHGPLAEVAQEQEREREGVRVRDGDAQRRQQRRARPREQRRQIGDGVAEHGHAQARGQQDPVLAQRGAVDARAEHRRRQERQEDVVGDAADGAQRLRRQQRLLPREEGGDDAHEGDEDDLGHGAGRRAQDAQKLHRGGELERRVVQLGAQDAQKLHRGGELTA